MLSHDEDIVLSLSDYEYRLSKHNWNFRLHTPENVYERHLWEDVDLENHSKASEQHATLYAAWRRYGSAGSFMTERELAVIRVRVGTLSSQEFDQAFPKLEPVAEMVSQEQAIKALGIMDRLCNYHDWFYWRNPEDVVKYRKEFDTRADLLQMRGANPTSDAWKLFHAWAKVKNIVGLAEGKTDLGTANGKALLLRAVEDLENLRIALKISNARPSTAKQWKIASEQGGTAWTGPPSA